MKNSVKTHGAAGDGMTDDTEAFRLALMRAGEVHVPNGTYVITDVLPVSRLCRGISSDSQGGVILAKHPEWGYDFTRYFRSAVIVPTTASYRVKCAAVRWAVSLCAKIGRIPDWLDRWRVSLLPSTEFYISHLTVVGAHPANQSEPSIGGIFLKSLDPHLQFTVHGNHFMTEQGERRKKMAALGPREAMARMIYDAFDAKFTDQYIGPLDAQDFTATLDGSFSFLAMVDIMENARLRIGPTDMVLVPAEPTDEMLAAMTDACGDKIFESGSEYFFRNDADALWFGKQVWAAMVRQGSKR